MRQLNFSLLELLSAKLSAIIAVSLILLILLPAPLLGLPAYWIRFLTNVFMWVGLAGSWNTIYGYTGRVDFGHVAFFGVGAYITSIMVLMGIPWGLGLLLGGILATGLAFFLGVPTLRLSGAYFAIATWASAEAMKQLFLILEITGGSYGLSLPLILTREVCYYLMFFTMLAVTFTNFLIERSRFGYGLRALRESETAASTLGINVFRYRMLAFLISAFFPGIIGGIYGLWINYVYPYDAFDGLKTDQMVVMTLLGGAGNYLGPVIGALLFTIAFEVFWTYWTEIVYLIFLGSLIVITVIFIPNGILRLSIRKIRKGAILIRLRELASRFRS